MFCARGAAFVALASILIVAAALRLHNIGFGLPSLYDPDEPIFMILSLKLLNEQTLNPGWFGHPGSTTIYLISLIDLAVLGLGMATSQYGSVAEFAAAAYANPALLFVPARVAMALFGVGTVGLTYVLARNLLGQTVALVAAAFLALNSLHIVWSQVIRTDVMAGFFMLASLIFAVRAARDGSIRHYLASGALVGVAVATKWPSVIVAVGLAGAAAFRARAHGSRWRVEFSCVAAALLCAIVALFLCSPYIFLDWTTVLANVGGEVRTGHLAQTGSGFFANLRWYLLGQVASSMGLVGLLLSVVGVAVAWRRERMARWTLLPVSAAFLALICSQSIVWSRWLVPAMPFACIFGAAAIDELARWISRRRGAGHGAITALVAVLAAAPIVASAKDSIDERAVDTRSLAARWSSANIPAGSTVLLEHLELSLRDRPWRLLFPFGREGCIDGRAALRHGVRYERIQQARKGSPIVDIGNVESRNLKSCYADYAILTYYDRYRAEAQNFPREVENYDRLLEGGRTVALFRPVPGQIGGPVVRIVALKSQRTQK